MRIERVGHDALQTAWGIQAPPIRALAVRRFKGSPLPIAIAVAIARAAGTAGDAEACGVRFRKRAFSKALEIAGSENA
jgi:hypothetical protein